MKISTILVDKKETACIVTQYGYLPIPLINQRYDKNWPKTLFGIITKQKLYEIKNWFYEKRNTLLKNINDQFIQIGQAKFAPLYRRPRKIWGIGLNYEAHAKDLSEKVPVSLPASFMKPDTTIIGYDDTIKIPLLSERTTGEAELGLIIGKECKNVKREGWRSVVAGFTPILDMTAEDILRKNPRYLTQAKSFDTFFSFGPILYTVDEVNNILSLQVQTVINGKVH